MTSRSGGLSESTNQRAVSAPNSAMNSSRSTVFFFDFDIFSTAPISTGAPVAAWNALRVSPSPSMRTSDGSSHCPPLCVR